MKGGATGLGRVGQGEFVSQPCFTKKNKTLALIKNVTHLLPSPMCTSCHINWLWIQDTVAAAFLVILQ